jgi:ubiquinone biosynthesis monooxygenase Coq7
LQGTSPLPSLDVRSRAIVKQMKEEEIEHAEHARAAGGVELPNAIKLAMAAMAKIMTTTAYRI